MSSRAQLLNDLAAMAGGAASAIAGIREEAGAAVRSHIEETLRRMNVVRRDEHEVVAAMVVKARQAQELAEARFAVLEARLNKLEAPARGTCGGGPGMIA